MEVNYSLAPLTTTNKQVSERFLKTLDFFSSLLVTNTKFLMLLYSIRCSLMLCSLQYVFGSLLNDKQVLLSCVTFMSDKFHQVKPIV